MIMKAMMKESFNELFINQFSHKKYRYKMREKLAFSTDEDKERFIKTILEMNLQKGLYYQPVIE